MDVWVKSNIICKQAQRRAAAGRSRHKRYGVFQYFEKLPPLEHGGPEMKRTCFHRNCWKKIAQNDRSHAMDISRITKVILKNCQKIGKMTHLTVKK